MPILAAQDDLFLGATSADGLAMKPSGSTTVTKCGSEMDAFQTSVCQSIGVWIGNTKKES